MADSIVKQTKLPREVYTFKNYSLSLRLITGEQRDLEIIYHLRNSENDFRFKSRETTLPN